MVEKSEKIMRMAHGVSLNAMPYNGQSAAKPRTEEGSTIRVYTRRATSDWSLEVVGVRKDEDMIYSHEKVVRTNSQQA